MSKLMKHLVKQRLIVQPILPACSLHTSNAGESEKQRLVKVAVIGDPNAGKSSLINAILGRRVNSVSRKVHTTRRNTLAVLNDGITQLVFVDTPGFVSNRSSVKADLNNSLFVDPYLSVHGVDTVVVVHDAENFYTKHSFSPEVLKALRFLDDNTKTVLTLNKVDLVKDKKELLTLTATLTKAPYLLSKRQKQRENLNKLFDCYEKLGGMMLEKPPELQHSVSPGPEEPVKFDQVFMTSAIQGIGIQQLKEYLLSQAKTRRWLYGDEFTTDQSDVELISLCVKEKLLDLLTEEIPYKIQPVVDYISENDSGIVSVQVGLPCSSRRLASAVMGKGGSTIRNVALAAELSLAEAFNKPVQLKVAIKYNKTVKARATG